MSSSPFSRQWRMNSSMEKLRAESLIVAHFAFLQVNRDLIVVDFLRPLHQLRNFVLAQTAP